MAGPYDIPTVVEGGTDPDPVTWANDHVKPAITDLDENRVAPLETALSGGTSTQVLSKTSATDYAFSWVSLPTPAVLTPLDWYSGAVLAINQIWRHAGKRWRRTSSTQVNPEPGSGAGWIEIELDAARWTPPPPASGDNGKALVGTAGDASWVDILANVPSYVEGAGSPVGALFPNMPGQFYFDTTNGDMYFAGGWELADWRQIATV